MAKISELPAAGSLTGAEPIMVVQDGAAKQSTIGALIEEAARPYVDLAAEQAALATTNGAAQVSLAQGFAGTAAAYGLTPLEQANWLLYMLEAKTLVRPALVTAETINTGGDSTVNGTGTTAPLTYAWPAQLSAMVTGGGSVVNGGIGGTTSAQMLATFTAASAAVKGQHQIVSTGLNDLSTLIGNRRDWAVGGYTKGNIASYKALITGGKQLCIILALRSDDSAPGQKSGADYTFHYRDMLGTYGADAINVHRYSVHVAERSGPDWFVTQRDFGVPLSKQGQGTQAIGVNNATHIVSAGTPASLAYDADTIAWDTTDLKWKRKIGATGAGSWADTDRKHRSRWGYADVAANARDWLLAVTGQGAPYAPPQEFRCAFDVAAGAVIGTVAIRTATSAFGSVDRAEIVAGNDCSVFTVDPFGRIYRSRLGTLQRKIYTLILKLTGSNGYSSLAIVDVFVGRASTQVLPQRLLIPEPVCLYGSEGHATASSKFMSGACWMRYDAAYSSAPYLITGLTGAAGSSSKFHVRLTNDAVTNTGRLQISLTNAANVNFFLATSISQNGGGVGIPRNTWGWLTWAVDLSTGAAPVAYWNDASLTWSGVATSNQDMPWADPSIMFLNSRALGGGDRTGVSPLTGGCGYLAWWNSYIDWSNVARRRELFNADGTAAITNTTGTVNGAAAAQVALQGEPVDLRWGGFNANQLVQINHDALRTMSIV